ncbi:MAG: hypothetical protein QOJ29_4049 [Thermoleophilaceae bacterium]|nr:hypothetical protein [Thermoleophilaceae bacterium]
MTETPDETIARLQRELDNAKIAKLQREISEVKSTGATDGSYSTWLPDSISMDKPQEPVDTRLSPAPRAVPLKFRLVVLPWSWWTIFTLFMVAITPIALWIFVPVAGIVAVAVTFLVIAVLRVRRYRLQMGLLKWGAVATVVNPNVTARGTYYSGTTYQNVRLAQAHGWQVERRWYSGPSTTTKIEYDLNGTRGELTMRGLPYAGGVILAHTKDPKRALCVSSYPYDLNRDPDGNWVSKLRARVVIGAVAMAVLLLVWTVGLTALFVAAALIN